MKEPTFEELQNISFDVLNNIKTTLANKVVQANTNKKYSGEFKISLIESVYSELKSYVNDNVLPDISVMSDTQLELLGFGKWDEDTGLRLIPLWAKEFIKNIEVISISGDVKMLSDIDTDTRFGCVAFGIIPYDYTDDKKTYILPDSLK